MRILLLDQFSDLGGAQQCLLDLLPAFRQCGWQALVGMPGDGPMRERAAKLGFETSRLECGPYECGRKSAEDLARFLTGTPPLARQIRRMAKRFEAGLVYINGPRLLPAVALAGVKTPVLFHSHSLLAGTTGRLVGAALRASGARVVASCRAAAEQWRNYVASEKVSVIYNGVAGPSGSGIGRKAAGPCVACIGRIAPEKGQLEFLTAAAIVHRAMPSCRFVISGAALFSGAEYETEVRAAAAGLPVEFTGWVNDVYPVLEQVDLLLVPSRAQEANPRVILEAFAAGVPVVSFPSGGIPEVVDHGVNSFLAGSAEEMADSAIRLLSGGRAALAVVSQAARETWRRRFTLQRYRQEVISILKSTAAAPATAAAAPSTAP